MYYMLLWVLFIKLLICTNGLSNSDLLNLHHVTVFAFIFVFFFF